MSSSEPRKISLFDMISQRAAAQIRDAEDKRVSDLMIMMFCCLDSSGDGICSKCGLPMGKGTCPTYDIGEVMDS